MILPCLIYFFALSYPNFLLTNVESNNWERKATYEEKQSFLNQALFQYTLQEKCSSDVDYALANLYVELGEDAWAVLYYEKAYYKGVDSPFLISRLKEARKRLGLMDIIDKNSLSFTFFSHFKWLLSFLVFSFFSCSLAIWFVNFRKVAIISLIPLFLILGNLIFIYYRTPLEGVLISGTNFYRSPDWTQPLLSDQPLLPGLKVRILEISTNREWLKIATPNDDIGYIPLKVIRSIPDLCFPGN